MTGSGRVLIVDDEEPIRDLVDFTLSRLGYEVSAAGGGAAGHRALPRSDGARPAF